MIYNTVVVGSGAAGLFAAMELSKKKGQKILLLEQVKRLHDTRNVSNGWMGGSAKSDLKLFTQPNVGGQVINNWATQRMLEYMQAHCKIKLRPTKDRLTKRFLKKAEDLNIQIDEPTVYNISSDRMIQIETGFQKTLSDLIEIRPNSKVDGIRKEDNLFILTANGKTYRAYNCILALGRGGANWLMNIDHNLDLTYTNDSFELGVRLEFPHSLLKDILDRSSTFRMRFDDYHCGSITTKGMVEMENVDENKTSNGRSIQGKQTYYSSFYMLKTFKQEDALNKVIRLVQMANCLADDQLLREPASRLLNETSVLSPIAEYNSIRTGIQTIFKLFPEIKNRCVVYAPEARLNALRYNLTKNMETDTCGLYLVGDMSGLTGSFGQAAGSGLMAARHINRNIRK